MPLPPLLRPGAAGVLGLILLAGSGLGPGCGRDSAKENSAQSRATPPPAATEAAPGDASTSDATGQPTGTPSPAEIDSLLAELTQAVRKFGIEQRRVPKSLEDLVASGYLTALPEAPEGKRFAIDKNLHVYLARR